MAKRNLNWSLGSSRSGHDSCLHSRPALREKTEQKKGKVGNAGVSGLTMYCSSCALSCGCLHPGHSNLKEKHSSQIYSDLHWDIIGYSCDWFHVWRLEVPIIDDDFSQLGPTSLFLCFCETILIWPSWNDCFLFCGVTKSELDSMLDECFPNLLLEARQQCTFCMSVSLMCTIYFWSWSLY